MRNLRDNFYKALSIRRVLVSTQEKEQDSTERSIHHLGQAIRLPLVGRYGRVRAPFMNLGVVDSSREGRKWKEFIMEMIPALERAWVRENIKC